jgi:hypothetical protein
VKVNYTPFESVPASNSSASIELALKYGTFVSGGHGLDYQNTVISTIALPLFEKHHKFHFKRVYDHPVLVTFWVIFDQKNTKSITVTKI